MLKQLSDIVKTEAPDLKFTMLEVGALQIQGEAEPL